MTLQQPFRNFHHPPLILLHRSVRQKTLFIDIIFALHYGFIFRLSDAVFTAIVPSV